VGATDWKTDGLEDYSSRGPTEDGRMKPEVVAPSGVSSAAFGEPWNGTSASCPHVSGAAALIMQAFPDYSPQQVTGFLTGRAKDIGANGPDSDSGYGRIWLGAPPALPNSVPGPTPTQPAVALVPTKTTAKAAPKPTSTPKLENKPVTAEDEFGWIANLILVGCVILPGFLGLAGIGLLGIIVYRRRSKSSFVQSYYPPAPPAWPAAPPAPAKPAAEAENQCLRCGALNRPRARFCISCGFLMQLNAPPAAARPVFCSHCGYALRPESKFCPNCGQLVE
jgi:hypothetical protein